MQYYLAIDIGASGGRHILGSVQNGKLVLEEIYRFENGMSALEDGTLTWDTDRLFGEIVAGMKLCKQQDKIPVSMAIDTWGVDYVLLDSEKNVCYPTYAYRDSRTAGMEEKVDEIIPREELYQRTGIQTQYFNTIYQLMSEDKSRLDKAAHFLMLPDYLAYRLSGKMANEYTEATTSGLVNAKEKAWDLELLRRLGIKEDIFLPLSLPGTLLGGLLPEIEAEVGYQTDVVLAPSHDTASAVAAIPLQEGQMFISSGTWSLAGMELLEPVTTAQALKSNFTNEGGVDYRFRFLKNITGMWMKQQIRIELGKKHSHDELMHMAENSSFRETVDVNDAAFAAPKSMIGAIREKLGKPELPLEDVMSCVYHSLATAYCDTVKEIEEVTGKTVEAVRIVGGGSREEYLNKLTAQYIGRRVFAGPTEATATGNIITQLMRDQGISLQEARALVAESFSVQEVK